MQALSSSIFEQIRLLVEQSRTNVARTVHYALLELYWQIGRLIVEDEQGGATRAKYGKGLISDLSKQLTTEFGKGFDESNLRNMRRFYLAYPIQDAARPKLPDTLHPGLSWTHYRLLLRIETPAIRNWYMNEEAATANWSARALERQINSHYYERLLSSQDRDTVREEASDNTRSLVIKPQDTLKDPYIFEFLGLPTADSLLEKDIEQALLDNLQLFLLELGRGFSFVGRQYRIATETKDFFIDLVFYHFRLKCFFSSISKRVH